MDVEGLLKDLTRVPGITWIVGPGPVVSENSCKGIKPPDVKNGVATIEADNWHFHLPLASVSGVEFVEQDDTLHPNAPSPRMYYVRFLSEKDGSPLRCYFPSPWRDEAGNATQFQPERLRLFEALRDRYVGQEGITFQRRVKQPAG